MRIPAEGWRLPCGLAPRLASLPVRLLRESEAGGWGEKATEDALCRPGPPASSSSLLLLGLRGYRPNASESTYPGGRVVAKESGSGCPLAHHRRTPCDQKKALK